MQINKKQIAFNRSPRKEPPRYIVIHDTGNTKAGANAESHYNYFNSADRQASADFFVDDAQILQVNDYSKYYSWHCGDGGGKHGITNGNSVGVEICVNSDGNYEKAVANAVELTLHLMAEFGVAADHVVRHYDASRKNCPASMAANNWARWVEFKSRLAPNTDAPSDWAKKAWDWATLAKITDGVNPQGAVSREQVVTMLHRFAERAGLL